MTAIFAAINSFITNRLSTKKVQIWQIRFNNATAYFATEAKRSNQSVPPLVRSYAMCSVRPVRLSVVVHINVCDVSDIGWASNNVWPASRASLPQQPCKSLNIEWRCASLLAAESSRRRLSDSAGDRLWSVDCYNMAVWKGELVGSMLVTWSFFVASQSPSASFMMLDKRWIVPVVVNVDLYSASTQTPLTRSDMDHTVLPANNTISAFTPQSHSITALWPVLTAPTHEGMARLSWPGWLVKLRQISRSGSWTPIRSPIPVLTGPGVE